MPSVGFFVCGTPSNSRGFELVELGPQKLPGTPGAYLDKPPAEAAECHRVESLLIDAQRYVQYGRVLRINPNDAAANRGAYVAVGCLIGERLPLHTVANCLDVVAELYGRVCAGLTPDRSFPQGFSLADFTIDGLPLDEKTAHECSPLLVADVVLQALNAEGPIDWPKVREVVLAPQEMTATDVGRYQLYSRQGALGSLASVDLTRAHLQQTVQRATAATETLLELQREWAALEGVAERLLTKGETFQHLTLEMERGVNEDRALEAAPAGRGRAAGTRAASGRAALYEREQPSAAASRIASPRAGAGRHAAYRRSGAPQSRSWGPGRSWARVLALVGTGGAIAVAAIFAAQRWLPTRAHDPEPQQVVVAPEQHDADADAEQEGAQPPSDVAKERAALDALPNE